VVGVYEDLEDAKKAKVIEEKNRAGKYDAHINRYVITINGYVLNELPEEIIPDNKNP